MHLVLLKRIPDASNTCLMARKVSRSSNAHPLPEANKSVTRPYHQHTLTYGLTHAVRSVGSCHMTLVLQECKKAWSRSTARPHPAGIPGDASTASDKAPLTRMRRRPLYTKTNLKK
eukprot:5263144-Amphidinium_carterae.1